jgi:hypothetical protein
LIDYSFTSRLKIFHSFGDVAIAIEVLQNNYRDLHVHVCSKLMAFELEGIFIEPHLLSYGALVVVVSSEDRPHLVTTYNKHAVLGTSFNPNLHGGYL